MKEFKEQTPLFSNECLSCLVYSVRCFTPLPPIIPSVSLLCLFFFGALWIFGRSFADIVPGQTHCYHHLFMSKILSSHCFFVIMLSGICILIFLQSCCGSVMLYLSLLSVLPNIFFKEIVFKLFFFFFFSKYDL